ncbi:MAG: phosphoribosylglycinamide formyltransferase, partial [Muribaculum sp.]|nr:phosphoribosylglycinamide formyltransferase [Muribaculum sp.]
TIHMVSEHYDEGRIIFQTATAIAPGDTPEIVARKVQRLEHDHYPRVIRETFA